MPVSTARPWSESVSVIRTLCLSVIACPCRSRRRQAFDEHALGGGHAAAEIDAGAELREAHFHGRHRGHDVELAEVADVRDAEDLALEMVLTAGEADPHLVAQVLGELAA